MQLLETTLVQSPVGVFLPKKGGRKEGKKGGRTERQKGGGWGRRWLAELEGMTG